MAQEKSRLRRWLPFGACCLPGIAAGLVVALGTVGGVSFDGPLSGLLVLAFLACPLVTVFMLMSRMYSSDKGDHSPRIAGCCISSSDYATIESERLSMLRTRREALEHEIVTLKQPARLDP